MSAALLEILSGRYSDDLPVAEVAPAEALPRSIRDHLERLFNSRRYTLVHRPDYGLPDIAAIYEALPYSLDGLVSAVRECIEKFEPRLQQVQVVAGPVVAGQPLQVELSGRLNDGRRGCWRVLFVNGGKVKVVPVPGGVRA